MAPQMDEEGLVGVAILLVTGAFLHLLRTNFASLNDQVLRSESRHS